ncbi:MAG TPA: response regulator transcription factor [Bacteroidia bacterium]|jgi:DNA-binding NarL/FixJ family response regulator|nr:response regulator transcription factor [Bacteroidia bacterium]
MKEDNKNKIYKIAVVDDQKLFRQGIISLLEEFEELKVVIEAENGKELANAMKKNLPDVILLDLEMPVMDGIETTSYVRKKYPDVKIVILTMHDDDAFISHLIEKGANGFLVKDSNIEMVVDAIYSVVHTGFHFSDRVSKAMVKGLIKSQKIKPSFNMANLTKKEIEVLLLICKEHTNKEISEMLGVSTRTIDGHRDNILQKTKARNTAGIVMFAVKNGLLE